MAGRTRLAFSIRCILNEQHADLAFISCPERVLGFEHHEDVGRFPGVERREDVI